MINTGDIKYIAGLLEGEGCFGFYNKCPSIQITMTDYDVIHKAKLILDIKDRNKIRLQRKGYYKVQYALNVSGDIAIQWMMTLYSLMGSRRKAKIKEVIQQWKDRLTPSQDVVRSRPRTMAQIKRQETKKFYKMGNPSYSACKA